MVMVDIFFSLIALVSLLTFTLPFFHLSGYTYSICASDET